MQTIGARAEDLPDLSSRSLLSISAFWLAINLHWAALLIVVMPSQVAQIHPERHGLILSWILGIGAVIALVMPPFVGAMSDSCAHRWGRRRPFMVRGTAVNLLGLGVMFAAGYRHSIPLYLLGYVAVQFGSNVASAAYSGVIPDLVPARQRGLASGWMAAMTQIGNILGAVVAGVLLQGGRNAAAYALISLVLLGFLLVTVLGTRETPLPEAPPRPSLRDMLRGLWIDPREHPDFAWVWITRFLFTAGMWMVQPFLQYYLRDVIGSPTPASDVGKVIGVALVGATVTGLIGGRISDRVGRKKVVYVANTAMALISLGFLAARTMEAIYGVAVLYGLAFGAYYSVDWALGCDVLPNKDEAAKDMGVWHISMVLPQSLAPFVTGLLLTLGGMSRRPEWSEPHYAMGGYTATFAVAAALLLLSAVLLRNVKGVR